MRPEPVNQAQFGGCPAHVKRQHLGFVDLGCDTCGKDGATGGAAFDQPDRQAGCRVNRGHAAARGHHQDRASQALVKKAALDIRQIPRHNRLDIGVGNGGTKPIEFARFGADLVTERDHHIRHIRFQQAAQLQLVRRICIGVHQAYRHGFDICGLQLLCQIGYRAVFQRGQLLTQRVHTPCDCESMLARHDQVGLFDIDRVLAIAPFIGDFEDIAETFGGDGRHFGPAPFNQRIGGKRGAVDFSNHLRDIGLGILQDPSGALQGAQGGLVGRGRRFCRGDHPGRGIHQNRVCECAANVAGKAQSVQIVHEFS